MSFRFELDRYLSRAISKVVNTSPEVVLDRRGWNHPCGTDAKRIMRLEECISPTGEAQGVEGDPERIQCCGLASIVRSDKDVSFPR